MKPTKRGGRRPNQTGRPPKPEGALIKSSVTLSKAQHEKVLRLSLARKVSQADVIRSAVDALPEEVEKT